jgi:hypothetical protein
MHYMRENLGVSIGAQGLPLATWASVRPALVFAGNASLVALPLGIRWTPAKWASGRALRPYFSGAVGPALGITNGVFTGGGTVVIGSSRQATIFTQIGAGFDYFPTRSLAIGLAAGYNRLGTFAEPVGAARNHSGPELNVSIGWMFGHGRPARASRTR